MTIRRIGKRANQGGMAFKPSLQDQRRASLQAQQAMAHDGMSDAAKQHLAEFAATVRPKRTNRPRTESSGKLEGDVQAEIIKWLCRHPRVALIERINSGAVYGEQGNFIRFHHIYMPLPYRHIKMRVVDLNVMMTNGRRLAIECKREGWRRPSDEREREQENYLVHVRNCGGIGIFATSTEDVRVALVAAGY